MIGSRRPFGFARSAEGVRVGYPVEIGEELVRIDRRQLAEPLEQLFPADSPRLGCTGVRDDVGDGGAVAREYETLAVLDGAHDGGRIVAQLALGDVLHAL